MKEKPFCTGSVQGKDGFEHKLTGPMHVGRDRKAWAVFVAGAAVVWGYSQEQCEKMMEMLSVGLCVAKYPRS